MKLRQAFDIVRGDVVSFIGAGGKTSALVGLGYELAEAGWRVLASTTTHIAEYQLTLMPRALHADAGSDAISAALTEDRFVFLYKNVRRGEVYGPEPNYISKLIDTVDSDVVLIEADVARGQPWKAPYEHEPVIPPETSLVVSVVSLSVLGKPLKAEHVYNVNAIMEHFGFPEGGKIRAPWIAQVMRDEQLGLYGVPPSARVIAFLNQAPAEGFGRVRARLIARLALRTSRLNGVAIGAVRGLEPVHEVQRPVGAVVLAAGLSSRMGQSKMLLPWAENRTIIEHIVQQLINSRIDYITVVTGHAAREVKEAVERMGVNVVHNRSYKIGEMLSSLKVGLEALPSHVAAALVVLGDQPRIQPKVIYQVTMAYAEGKGEIIAPSFEMRRGHPILIGRRYWPEILALPRDGSPRDVINAHQREVAYVNVDTDSILRDVDTPDDYDQERWRAGLGRYGKSG